jgi:hypothetical protein
MPHSDPDSIPLGVKMTDEVLANELSTNDDQTRVD